MKMDLCDFTSAKAARLPISRCAYRPFIGVHRRLIKAENFSSPKHLYISADEHDERRCPDSLTERVIAAIPGGLQYLGPGFLEKVYERACLGNSRFVHGIQATCAGVVRQGVVRH